MSKRTNGEGSITFDKTRNTYRVAISTPDGKRIFKRFKTKDEALRWKSEQLHDIHHGTFVAPTKMTLGQWLIEWLSTYKQGTVKPRTYESYCEIVILAGDLLGRPLQELTGHDLQKQYQLLSDTRAPATITKLHRVLHGAIKKAEQMNLVRRNFILDATPPKIVRKEIVIFTPDEIKRILTSLQQGDYVRYYPLILLAATTGMRMGELLGLRWCDVDLKKQTIHIKQQISYTKSRGMFADTPKSSASIRRIAITDTAAAALSKLREQAKCLNIDGTDLCFQTKNRTAISQRNLTRAWKAILQGANIPYKNFHVLRHTHATEIANSQISILEVGRRIGHSSPDHTLRMYGHAIPGYDRHIADKIEAIYHQNN